MLVNIDFLYKAKLFDTPASFLGLAKYFEPEQERKKRERQSSTLLELSMRANLEMICKY